MYTVCTSVHLTSLYTGPMNTNQGGGHTMTRLERETREVKLKRSVKAEALAEYSKYSRAMSKCRARGWLGHM